MIFCWLILASILRGLACFSNVWQTRNVMRMGPALEFFSLLLFLILSLVTPSLLYFSLALLASQIPPFFWRMRHCFSQSARPLMFSCPEINAI